LQQSSAPLARQDGRPGALKSRGQRPDLVPWEAGSELGRPLPSRRSCPRRDLYTSNNGGASATENLTHFKSTKILRVI
ncbi:hypothetical protein B296_00025380, partial [Ensete ventricosum]